MSLWLIPMIYAAASFLGGITLPRLEQAYFPYNSGISVASAQAFLSAVASGMIGLTGIVFTVGLVMVQFSAIAYSPRLVLLLARDPKLFHSLGVFIATFTIFSLHPALCRSQWVRGRAVDLRRRGRWIAFAQHDAVFRTDEGLDVTSRSPTCFTSSATGAAKSCAKRFSASMGRQKINRSADQRRAMFLNWVRLSKR